MNHGVRGGLAALLILGGLGAAGAALSQGARSGDAVGRQDEGGQVEGGLFVEVGLARRHLGLDVLRQVRGGLGPPLPLEVGPGQLRALVAAEIGGVGGAALGSRTAKNSTHCDGR